MTTKMHRGRDPEQHMVQSSAEAATHVGKHGEITLERESAEGAIIALRAHNGYDKGGARVALEDPASVAGMLPNAKVLAPLEYEALTAGDVFTIHHQLGYEPMVLVIDEDGRYADVAIVHDDEENVSITFADAGLYKVQLR